MSRLSAHNFFFISPNKNHCIEHLKCKVAPRNHPSVCWSDFFMFVFLNPKRHTYAHPNSLTLVTCNNIEVTRVFLFFFLPPRACYHPSLSSYISVIPLKPKGPSLPCPTQVQKLLTLLEDLTWEASGTARNTLHANLSVLNIVADLMPWRNVIRQEYRHWMWS